MNLRSHSISFLGAACVAPFVLTVAAFAQDEDIGSLVNKALVAMRAHKWEEALALSTKTVNDFGKNNPQQLYGAQFGTIYYRKGICELKLKKWDDAMASFQTCYDEFPNAGDVAGGGNLYQKMALLKWGDAALGEGDWKLAIQQYEKFLKERDKTRDKYSKGAFHVSMAICRYNLGQFPEGNDNLEIAINNKRRFPTPDAAIVAGFQALVTGAVLKGNEQVMIDFIDKNRGELVIPPYEMQQYSRVFMKLAGDAVGADMNRAALSLYQFVPSTEVALDDTRVRLKAIGDLRSVKDGSNVMVKGTLEKNLEMLEAEMRGKKMPAMVKLAAAAFIHEKAGNVRGAYSSYLQLETYYPNSEKREDNLFNLVRTASIMVPGLETQKYAERFVKDFPKSAQIPVVRRLMLSSLFYDGEYELCIEVAESMIETLDKGTPEHDICLHVLSGSYFYTGEYDKAKPLLDQHVEEYPESLFVIPARYFQASNISRLQFWSKAAGLLDNFLKDYPDAAQNIFLPFALYDRASCHFAEEQAEGALECLARIIKEFPECNVVDQAYNLRGNVEESIDNDELAEKAYLRALEIAETRGNAVVAGESLYSLVALLGEAKKGKEEDSRLKEAVPYADRFWKNYADGSPYKPQVAVAQVPAFYAVDRGEEALNQLRDVISEMAKNPEAFGLEALINSYTEAYLEQYTPEELKEHYYNFPGIRSTDRAARALLRVAVIGVFEDVIKKSKDAARVRSGKAMIKVLFQQLKTDFALKNLTNFILVKVGDYLRLNTSTPREALPYYEEVLGRSDQSYRFPALLGQADVYGGPKAGEADIDKAIEAFTRVYDDSQEKSEREFSLFRIVELQMAKGDYVAAAEKANVYLDRKTSGFSKFSAKVGLLLANSFEGRKMVNDAIAMYVKIWSAHMGNIKISAPAMLSWMKLSWDRNQSSKDPAVPGDRQGAYEGGAKYIKLTGRFKDKMSDEDLELWNEVNKRMQTYEANPNIKSMAEIEREKAEAR